MRTVRYDRWLIPTLLIFISACSGPEILPTILHIPTVGATETKEIPADLSPEISPTIVNMPTVGATKTEENRAYPPDIIFYNGDVITMDDNQPRAQAIAIAGERILAVGTNEEIVALNGLTTQVVDLQGKTVTPGFIDSHQHRIEGDFRLNYTEPDPLIRTAIEQGWTTLDELYVTQPDLDEFRALDQQGRLRLRVNAYLAINENTREVNLLGPFYKTYSQGQMVSPHVRVAGVKVFTDFNNAEVLIWEQDDLNALLLNLHQEGWQLSIKTISTRSLEMILKAFEYIETIDPNIIRSRGRLEHALFSTPEQITRIHHFGLVPIIHTSVPSEFIGSRDMLMIPLEPQGSAFPWRNLIEANVTIANASSWPSYYVDEPAGAPFGSPIRLIYQGPTRAGNLGVQPEAWMLDQTITAEDAMRALTINGAYATFQEDILGSLTVGKLADLVILSDNPLGVETKDINNIKVLMTMIGGGVEYCAIGQQSLCPGIQLATRTPSPETGTLPTTPFTGTWEGADPIDGSIITISLVQTENSLTGAYKDTYSPSVQPPGYEGLGTGTMVSTITAQMTFDVSRWDGKTLLLQYSLTLSNQNNTLTLTCDVGCPIVMQRK